jgi:hypothetical protein
VQRGVAAVEQASIIGCAITGKPGTKCTSPTEKPGILLYGLAMIGALREHAHVQAVQVVGPVGLEGHALLARHVLHALLDQVLGPGCSTSGTAQRGRGALAGVVVGRGADAAAAEDDVAAGEGLAQRGGDARPVVAHVARPGQRQAARRQQLDHLGHVLVLALAGQDLVADDDEAELAGKSCQAKGCFHGGDRAAAAARACRSGAGGQRIVREPQAGEHEDQGVEPDRPRSAGRQHQRQRAHGPQQRRRAPAAAQQPGAAAASGGGAG